MRSRILTLALLVALLAAAPASAAGPRATASTALALRLERILEPNRNLAVSPLSLQFAFATADAGARGATRAQIAKALRLQPDGTPLHRAMAQLAATLAQRPQLQMANALWSQSGYPVRSSYRDLLARFYAAAPQTLDVGVIARTVAALKPGELSVSLPRFKVESELDMVGPLRRLGVVDAFLPARADFSAMTPRARADGLHIAEVRHAAWIAVDETGTEAAAATGIGVAVSAAPAGLVMDRPFLFVIRDRPTGAILFLGRVLDPTA